MGQTTTLHIGNVDETVLFFLQESTVNKYERLSENTPCSLTVFGFLVPVLNFIILKLILNRRFFPGFTDVANQSILFHN